MPRSPSLQEKTESQSLKTMLFQKYKALGMEQHFPFYDPKENMIQSMKREDNNFAEKVQQLRNPAQNVVSS